MDVLEDRTVPSTLPVWRSADDPTQLGTLRYAVAHAASGDTILLVASLRDTPIVLTHGELRLDKDLTIAVAGNTAVTVSGGDTSRVFEITVGAHVTLSGLTITHGRGVAAPGGSSDTDGEGGGVLNAGTLTISGCTLTNNPAAPGAPIFGGGIFNDPSGTLTVSGSTLSNNFPYFQGGGILNLGTATVTGSTLSDNFTYGDGGGIANYGTLTVSGSTLSGNVAGNNGGAIANDTIFGLFPGTVTITGSTLSGNAADNLGGGINNINGTVTVSGSTLSGNSAALGGGIFTVFGTVTISGGTLSHNSAEFDGGGIYNFGGVVSLASSIVFGNTPDNIVGGFLDLGGNIFGP